LDEEIARLPEHLRAAVVLCELDGLGRKDAALRLGVPQGTLSSRLAKARKLLARRLHSRGVALPAAGLAALFGGAAPADAVQRALANAAANLASPGPVPAMVTELSREVFRVMLLNKVKALMVGLAVLAALAGGLSGWAVLRSVQAGALQEKPTTVGSRPERRPGPGRIFYCKDTTLYLMDPDGKKERQVDLPQGAGGGSAVPSCDGRWLAYWTEGEDDSGRAILYVRALDGKEVTCRVKLPAGIGFLSCCWSPDGSGLHINTGTPGLKGVQHRWLDLKTKQLTTLELLKTHLVTGWSPDGKCFLTTAVGGDDEWEPKGLYLMNRDGTERMVLTRPTDQTMSGLMSPDGKRVLCLNGGRLLLLDVGKPESLTPVAGIPVTEEVVEFAWSPGGRRIVYTTGTDRPRDPQARGRGEARLVVADPDGKNTKVLRTAKGEMLGRVHWR
jgi:hypothetical protein